MGMFHKIQSRLGDDAMQGKRVAIWGLSFKPNTDDMREAPSLVVIDALLKSGCRVRVYDPIAMSEAKKILGDSVEYGKDIYDTVNNADALLLLTEWQEFRLPNWEIVGKVIHQKIVIDGRNIYEPSE